jgi:hypothetical protein
MIRQRFSVDGYWGVVVFYDLDYHFFGIVVKELEDLGFPRKRLERLYHNLKGGRVKAVTCSNGWKRKSVVLFTKHKDRIDYINSLVHEAEHVKQSMLKAYQVSDEGEPPAYTIGYLVGRMWEVFGML